ncbi:MAG: hypothetical protein ACM3S2_18895 [Ignavibacteriales bacterium]
MCNRYKTNYVVWGGVFLYHSQGFVPPEGGKATPEAGGQTLGYI